MVVQSIPCQAIQPQWVVCREHWLMFALSGGWRVRRSDAAFLVGRHCGVGCEARIANHGESGKRSPTLSANSTRHRPCFKKRWEEVRSRRKLNSDSVIGSAVSEAASCLGHVRTSGIGRPPACRALDASNALRRGEAGFTCVLAWSAVILVAVMNHPTRMPPNTSTRQATR
jgi:hypothetical protein